MIFSWNLWFDEALFAYVVVVMLAGGITHLRFKSDKKLRTIIFFILAYLVCVGASLGHSLFQQKTDELVKQLKNTPESALISSDWGDNFSKEDRLKYSQGIASMYFVNSGKWRDYIDLNGKLTPYQPTELDRQNRKAYLLNIEQQEYISKQLLGLAIGWMLLPLIGVGMGFRSENSHACNCKIEISTRKNKFLGTIMLGSTPEACLAFLFFGYCIGWISLAFYRSSHLLGAFLFLTLFVLSIVIAIRRGMLSLGFKFYSWSAVIYASFFIMGFAIICYQVFIH